MFELYVNIRDQDDSPEFKESNGYYLIICPIKWHTNDNDQAITSK